MSSFPFPCETYTYGLPIKTFLYMAHVGVVGGGCYADVHLPPATAARPATGYPVVMVIHGGGFITGCRRQQPPAQVDYLLARGLAIVDVEYRLLPHANLDDCNADVLAAFTWIRDELNGLLADGEGDVVVNGSSIGVMGDSAGGYLSLMLGITTTPPPRAVVPFYGLSDLTTLAAGSKEDLLLGYSKEEAEYINRVWSDGTKAATTPDWEHPDPRTAWRKAVFASESLAAFLLPEDTADARKQRSPLHLATSAYPPTFLAVPQFDLTVASTQSWKFAEKLKALGVEVAAGRANSGGHCFDRKGGALNEEGGQWWTDVTEPALAFLIKHLTV